ncbi:MAG: hypothetical protein R2715_24130 [Ilumatobacteraceae bacterium]
MVTIDGAEVSFQGGFVGFAIARCRSRRSGFEPSRPGRPAVMTALQAERHRHRLELPCSRSAAAPAGIEDLRRRPLADDVVAVSPIAMPSGA